MSAIRCVRCKKRTALDQALAGQSIFTALVMIAGLGCRTLYFSLLDHDRPAPPIPAVFPHSFVPTLYERRLLSIVK